MKVDIGSLVSECLNNNLIQHYYMKKKNMSYKEEDTQSANFSRMLGYVILFKETDGIEEYMAISDKDEQVEFLKRRVASKLNIPQSETEARKEELISYVFKHFVEEGYVFHAGNSRSIEKNMTYGLKGNVSSLEEKQELLYIASIFEKYGSDQPMVWASGDIEHGATGWFFDSQPQNMLGYADSPEWFELLCGGSGCYGWGFVPEENRHAYRNRDYETCLLNITKLIEKNNMNETDRKTIIDFFNKCWAKFGDSKPYLMFVPVDTTKEELEYIKTCYFPSMMEGMIRKWSNGDEIFKDVIKGGCFIFGQNVCSHKDIPPEVLSCVDLSPILPRFKVSEQAKQREITVQECMRMLNGLDIEKLLQAQEFLGRLENFDVERGM